MDVTREMPFPPAYLRQCPSCDRPLAEHLYADRRVTAKALADVAYAYDSDELPWPEFANLYPPAAETDTTVLRILRCPDGGGALLPLDLAPTVYGDDRVLAMVVCLNARSVSGLAEAMPGAWQEYSRTWETRGTAPND